MKMPIITVKNVDLPILIAYHMDGTISMLFKGSHPKKKRIYKGIRLKGGRGSI